MTTPLIILAILFTPTLLAALIGMATRQQDLYLTGGRIAFAAAFAFFSIGHFVSTDGMVEMLPNFVPERHLLIYATGILEAGLALSLLVPSLRRKGGIACIAVLVLFFPANIYAAMNHLGLGGHQWGPVYLLIRAPLQFLLIGWAYWFTVRADNASSNRFEIRGASI